VPDSSYEEEARSYASPCVFVPFLGAGFILDLILGGSLAHLLGWLLALVIVVGIDAMIVPAVRSERSLRLNGRRAARRRRGDRTQ
jgi:ABC-type thiamin/hydroxymethylpyrimidine transport system permease subunit